jgi:capsid protein
MFEWVARLFGRTKPAPAPARREPRPDGRADRRPRAKYDAAATNEDNRRHWANADGLSARAANNLGVRRLLRNRSRYERENNGYCGGLVSTLANDLFGTGPRLQVQTTSEPFNRAVEQAFHAWADAVCLNEKLITAKEAKTGDGEAFLLLAADEVPGEPVHLDVIGVECDQVTTPVNAMPQNLAQWVDGIEMDARGRPTFYHVLKAHPGDNWNTAILYGEYERLPAAQVIHWFRASRPGQARGVPEITPGLPLCAQMRRWTLATLTAAETAADMAILLTSEAPPESEEENSDPPFTTLEIDRGLMTQLPAGTDAKQMAAEHPGQEYAPFKAEILNEFGRPVHAPKNVVTGSSAEYNYSSARMDYLLYRAAQKVERDGCRRKAWAASWPPGTPRRG